jgi:hypothetical protein
MKNSQFSFIEFYQSFFYLLTILIKELIYLILINFLEITLKIMVF